MRQLNHHDASTQGDVIMYLPYRLVSNLFNATHDLIGNVWDNLDCFAQILTPSLLRNHSLIHFAFAIISYHTIYIYAYHIYVYIYMCVSCLCM